MSEQHLVNAKDDPSPEPGAEWKKVTIEDMNFLDSILAQIAIRAKAVSHFLDSNLSELLYSYSCQAEQIQDENCSFICTLAKEWGLEE